LNKAIKIGKISVAEKEIGRKVALTDNLESGPVLFHDVDVGVCRDLFPQEVQYLLCFLYQPCSHMPIVH
jgi:hypothetical protein